MRGIKIGIVAFLTLGVLTVSTLGVLAQSDAPAPDAMTTQPIELPAQIPAGIESGTLKTPLGPARWVHLSGDESSLPRWLYGLARTPDGFVVPEWDGTTTKLWRSPDLISWSADPLAIEARYGELSEADGSYWLSTSEPAGLWRSQDTIAWERVDLDGLDPPGPDGYAWVLRPGMPVAYDGVIIVPFQWGADYQVVARELPGIDTVDVHDSREVEPGVYEFFNYGTGPLATVRFEETEGGVRVFDHEDGRELTDVEGVSLEFIERMHREGIPGVNGLAILDGDELVETGLPDGISRARHTVWTVDEPGFAAYSIGDGGLVGVHSSQYGRGWHETDVLGDEVGEPTGIVWASKRDGQVTLESTTGVTWTTTDGVVWESHGPPPEMFDTRFASGWIQLPMGGSANPVTGAEEPGRLWFQPEDGEPAPIDVTEMAFPVNDGISGPNCGGSESFISSNTSVSSFDEECDGLREHWIITFDDVPA